MNANDEKVDQQLRAAMENAETGELVCSLNWALDTLPGTKEVITLSDEAILLRAHDHPGSILPQFDIKVSRQGCAFTHTPGRGELDVMELAYLLKKITKSAIAGRILEKRSETQGE